MATTWCHLQIRFVFIVMPQVLHNAMLHVYTSQQLDTFAFDFLCGSGDFWDILGYVSPSRRPNVATMSKEELDAVSHDAAVSFMVVLMCICMFTITGSCMFIITGTYTCMFIITGTCMFIITSLFISVPQLWPLLCPDQGPTWLRGCFCSPLHVSTF